MKQVVLSVLVVIGVLILGLFWQRKQKATPPREFKNTDDYIQFMANEAVDDAEKQDHIRLDYSIDSIKKVEEILGRMHDQYVKDRTSLRVNALASAYGAYIGEVIRRSEPETKWERDHPDFGEKTYPLHWSGGNAFPMGWCYKRITKGDEDNVWVKYTILKQQAEQKAH
jgi:hypothetical protein